jgi:hypothetical protein
MVQMFKLFNLGKRPAAPLELAQIVTPFDEVATIPLRILEVEKTFGISSLESVETLGVFGIKTLADLAKPITMLQNINPVNLSQFAGQYETRLNYLQTGTGRVHQTTHTHISPIDIVLRILECWLAGELRGIFFLSNRGEPSTDHYSPISLVIKRQHPHLDTHTLIESWPAIRWDGAGRVVILTLIQWFMETHQATKSFSLYPQGLSVHPTAYTAWEDGKIHLMAAMQQTGFSWHPESSLTKRKPDLDNIDLWAMVDFPCRIEGLREAFHQAVDSQSASRD